MEINKQYNVAGATSLASQIAQHQRRKMFRAFLSFAGSDAASSILDVGVTSDTTYHHSNYFEAWYPYPSRITAVGLDNAAFLETIYPGLRFVEADGRDLPFADGSFDIVHSSAVLEHVGNRSNQKRFVSEMWRVARHGLFLTTPNRWFPIEFHTLLPLVHWLPAPWFRKVLRAVGHDELAREENLNLVTGTELAALATECELENYMISSVGLSGLPTNLLLMARKNLPAPLAPVI